MAYVITNNQHYINIADAIRSTSFGNIEGPLAPDEFAQCIEQISTIGQMEGESKGHSEGYAEGFEQGKEAGVQSEYDRFWDEFQQNGNRTSYCYAFGGTGWNSETFKPKYDMKPQRSDCMFHTSGLRGDLVAILENCGVSIDLSTCGTVAQTYVYAVSLTHIGIQDTRAAPSLQMMFYYCSALATIDKLILKDDGSQVFSSAFHACPALENIVIEGKIGQNGFNVSGSTKLTHDSLLSIINALADKSADTSGTAWAATLGTENLAKLTDEEKAIATEKGWTLA